MVALDYGHQQQLVKKIFSKIIRIKWEYLNSYNYFQV